MSEGLEEILRKQMHANFMRTKEKAEEVAQLVGKISYSDRLRPIAEKVRESYYDKLIVYSYMDKILGIMAQRQSELKSGNSLPADEAMKLIEEWKKDSYIQWTKRNLDEQAKDVEKP